jgi:hypothetical protein
MTFTTSTVAVSQLNVRVARWALLTLRESVIEFSMFPKVDDYSVRPDFHLKTIQIDIVSVQESIFTGHAELAILPGEAGELGVLPGHAPCSRV